MNAPLLTQTVTAPAMVQTGDGSTLADDEGPDIFAVGAVVSMPNAAISATFVVRSRRSTNSS